MWSESDKITFGKYATKNLTFRDLLVVQPGYLAWLREQKMKDNGRIAAQVAFSADLHKKIDDVIRADKSLRKKYVPFDEQKLAYEAAVADLRAAERKPDWPHAEPPKASKEERYAEWGAF